MIIISSKQKGNELIDHLKGTTSLFSEDTTIDYEINGHISITFLSLRFHLCRPDYIYTKLKSQKRYRNQILLILADVKNYEKVLDELFFVADRQRYTVLIAFSNEEAAKYIRCFAVRKNLNMIRRTPKSEDESFLMFLSSFPKINKTDASNIMKNSKDIIEFVRNLDSKEGINGLGKRKIEIIKEYLHRNFIQ